MVKIRLNDVNICVEKNNVIVEDFFLDITAQELARMVEYLATEGFINKDSVQIFIRKKNLNENYSHSGSKKG